MRGGQDGSGRDGAGSSEGKVSGPLGVISMVVDDEINNHGDDHCQYQKVCCIVVTLASLNA